MKLVVVPCIVQTVLGSEVIHMENYATPIRFYLSYQTWFSNIVILDEDQYCTNYRGVKL